MPIAQLYSSLQVDSVQSVQVSAVIFDSVNNIYVRLIQIYDQAYSAGVRPRLEITITGATAAAVELTTPQLSF
jgi:hypothetical protein